MVRGIDVSDYQGTVNWPAVARAGIEFAVTKATEGGTFVADSFTRNWSGIRSAGLVRGAYHFYRPRTDALAQANLFLNIVKLQPGDLPPVLDIESDDGVEPERIRAGIRSWLVRVEEVTQRRPILYTYPSFWERLGNWQDFTDYPLWVAHYTTAERPWIPGGWRTWAMWQFTDSGTVSGVTGPVDVNSFNVIRAGSQSMMVVQVQRFLRAKGYDIGALDGVFGLKSQEATRQFQMALGLTATGEITSRTWAYLLDATITGNGKDLKPPESDKTMPTPTDEIKLIDVMKFYQDLPHQAQALSWLQSRLEGGVLQEFARRWRNDSSSTAAIQLVDVAKFYRNLASQNQALQWLEGQVSSGMKQEFAQRWRSPQQFREAPIVLANAAQYYQGMSHQKQAWQWLQERLSHEDLAEFARLWRQ
ncbi:peptidoglycan-binding protein [Phormidium yuhuli AB48]|uniref:Peptidoglycan-binding protein n=1 Tax=Phormidium yuhuli AB48 TaxID=2940671 RepID=A0ABY5ARX3_9CYAN|nr:GH25 family lysozyme [Phormidium yuhuli]USR91775.1 peptidoglycan-binding protein [Phormidium yuhuli AB48]